MSLSIIRGSGNNNDMPILCLNEGLLDIFAFFGESPRDRYDVDVVFDGPIDSLQILDDLSKDRFSPLPSVHNHHREATFQHHRRPLQCTEKHPVLS